MSFLPQDRAAELKQLFFESAEELLQRLNEEGLELEKRSGDAEIIRSLRRTVHTLKGDSATCGYGELSELAHKLEDVLTPERAAHAHGAVAEVVLAAADTFHAMLQAYRSDTQPPAGDTLRRHLQRLVSAPEEKPAQSLALGFEWAEYEQRVIAAAASGGASVYNIALGIDPQCPVPAALQLVKNALQEVGTVLALRPDQNAPAAHVKIVEVALASDRNQDWIARKCRIPGVVSDLLVQKLEAASPSAVQEGGASLPPHTQEQEKQEANIFNDIARALTSSLKLDDVLHTILEKVAQYFRPDTWSLLLADETKDELYFAIATGPAAESLKKVRLKMGEGIAGWVARHDEPVIVPDVYRDPRFAKRIDEMVKFQTRSIVCVPMRSKGRVLGVIQLINCATEKMAAREMSFLQALSDYAAIAIDNAHAAEAPRVAAAEDATAAAPTAPANILRVDAERIDTVLNLVGELIIGKSMLHQALGEFEKRFPKDPLRARIADAMAFQARVMNDLQKSVMKVRMVPVEQLFRRLPRLVRDVAKLSGKEVQLAVSGEDTDLDKSILDLLTEPLTHLVRNAVDHGIESPQERLAAGKPAQGTVRLDAYHQGNQIVIEVGDDGRGIDRQRVLARAMERGLVTAEEAARMGEDEALNLIFQPGFSTADQVTQISGRGVGMDVVRNVLQQLKGTVSTETRVGQGTTFLLKVPLTLAIINALLFRAADRLYAVPLSSVLEIARADETQVHRVDGHEVIRLRDQVLKLVRLSRLANRSGSNGSGKLFVVVIALADRKFGLVVDKLVGEEELVIKAMEDPLVASDLVSGASILGDGTVVLILNISAVVERLGKAQPVGAYA